MTIVQSREQSPSACLPTSCGFDGGFELLRSSVGDSFQRRVDLYTALPECLYHFIDLRFAPGQNTLEEGDVGALHNRYEGCCATDQQQKVIKCLNSAGRSVSTRTSCSASSCSKSTTTHWELPNSDLSYFVGDSIQAWTPLDITIFQKFRTETYVRITN
jgi:hypothetical protein